MTPSPRSWLYVPADRPDRYAKALASGADRVVVDLEDSVGADRKEYARDALLDWLTGAGQPVVVRINPPGSTDGHRDLERLAAADLRQGSLLGVRVPKCETPAQIQFVADHLTNDTISLHPLIESALGVLAARDLAVATPSVVSFCLGAGDLVADLGVGAGPESVRWAESLLIYVSRAVGLAAPPMSVFPLLGHEEELAADCRRGRSLGFHGRSAIHPAQIAVINGAFTPTQPEVEQAHELLSLLGDGGGVTVLNGLAADQANARRARHVIALAHEYSIA